MTQKRPVVDDADVDHMINFLFGARLNSKLSAEQRADAAYQIARDATQLVGHSKEYAEALAQRVRARALWIKAPTGKPEPMPE